MKRKIYQVNVKEVHIQPHLIIANSAEEAKQRIADAEDGLLMEEWFEYSHSTDPDTWEVISEDEDQNLKDYRQDIIDCE